MGTYIENCRMITQRITGLDCQSTEWQGELITICFPRAYFYLSAPWRGYRHDILAGSGSEEKIQRDMLDLAAGAKLVCVEIVPPWHDLKLAFDNSLCLEVFQDSDQYENWNLDLRDPDGRQDYLIVAGPGTGWCDFERIADI
jgi:hypothetical protein